MASIDRIRGIVDLARTGSDRAEAKQMRLQGQEAAQRAAEFLQQGDLRGGMAELSAINPDAAANFILKANQIDPEFGRQFQQTTQQGATKGQLISQSEFGSTRRQLLDRKLSAEQQAREGASDFEKLSKVSQDQFKTVESQFLKFTGDAQQQMSKIGGLKTLAKTAQKSEQAASQLGAQVATMFESGRLTDEDVKRYTRRNALPSRIQDLMLNWTEGTISNTKAADLEIALDAFQGVLTEQVNRGALDAAKKLNSRVNTGMSNEQVAKMLLPDFDVSVLNPVKEEISVDRFQSLSPDEQFKALQGMSDDELKKFIQKLEQQGGQ